MFEPGLKKARKASQNVNQYDYINVSKHSKIYLIVLETLKQIHQGS